MAMQRVILAATFVLAIATLAVIDRYDREHYKREERRQLAANLENVAEALENGLRLRIFAVEDLRAFLLTSPEIPDDGAFARFAGYILPGYPALRALQYADTAHIIRYTYPREGNEDAIGLDLMARPAARYVQQAIDTRSITLSEPTVTVQGPLAVVARTPLFRDNTYLGLAQGVFEISSLLEEATDSLEPHFNLVVEDDAGQIFWGAPAPSRHAAQSTMRVGNLAWNLTLGWSGPPARTVFHTLSSVWIPGLVALAGLLYAICLAWRCVSGLAVAVETTTAELHLAVQAAGIGLWDWNLLTNEVYISPEWKAQLGYADDEFPNRYEEWESRLHPDERGPILARLADAMQPPWPPFVPEIRLRHRDGSYRWILVRSEVMRDGDDRPCRMLGCHIDITERKQAEEELRAAKNLHESTLESLNEVVMVIEPGSRTILQCNRAAELVFGYSPAELIGQPTKILHVDAIAHERFASLSEPVLERGEAFQCEFEMRKKDGSLIQTEHVVTAMGGHAGWRGGVVSVVRDVTERRKAETEHHQLEGQLRHAQKMEAIGTLAGGIAHDFNNILAAIMGYGELVQAQLDPESSTHADMERVLSAANRAQSLVRQILTFSRRVDDVRLAVDFADVVTEALKLLRPSLPSTITIETGLEAGEALILADPSQLHQVVVNLCTNAYQAMENGGGTLRIALKCVELDASFVGMRPELQTGAYVVLSVSDTGPGMAPQTVARIFEPFFTTKSQGKGTGLGLATVHGIVASHGGAITVASEPGEGSQFDVYLPRVREEAAAAPALEEPARPGNERILVVDDEVVLAQLVQKSLEKFGYDVLAIGSSTAALALIQHDPARFDLVITDLTMPQMTGRQLAAEVRAVRADLPIILITGFADQALLDGLAGLGVKSVLTKPVRQKHIARIVREVLDAASKDTA